MVSARYETWPYIRTRRPAETSLPLSERRSAENGTLVESYKINQNAIENVDSILATDSSLINGSIDDTETGHMANSCSSSR
jgi:hypothetical protein